MDNLLLIAALLLFFTGLYLFRMPKKSGKKNYAYISWGIGLVVLGVYVFRDTPTENIPSNSMCSNGLCIYSNV